MKPRLNSILRILGWGAAVCGGASGLVFAADVTLSGATGNSCTYSSITTDASGNVTVECSTGGGGGTSPTIAFSPTSYSVAEGGTRSVTIVRGGDTSGAASVTVTQTGGSASSGPDYTAFTETTVNFTAGDATPKTVTLTTVDDSDVEGNETVVLSLSNAVGATLGASTATVTITDNDTSNGSCSGTFPADHIQAAGWYVNSVAGTTVNLPSPYGNTAKPGEPWAQEFTISSAKPHLRINLGYSTQLGGTAAKEITVSACPGDFSSNVPSQCRRTLSNSGATNIYIMDGSAYCDLPPGKYYLNIRAMTSTPASAFVSATQLP